MRHHYRKKTRPPKPKRFDRKVQQLFGQIAAELGDSAERCVDEALKKAKAEGKLPAWLIGWNRQEKWSVMDKEGIDFMFQTDVAPIFLQIKSSKRNAREFEREHPNDKIRTVVVNIRDSQMTVFGQVMGVVAKQRDKFLAFRTAPM